MERKMGPMLGSWDLGVGVSMKRIGLCCCCLVGVNETTMVVAVLLLKATTESTTGFDNFATAVR